MSGRRPLSCRQRLTSGSSLRDGCNSCPADYLAVGVVAAGVVMALALLLDYPMGSSGDMVEV